MNIKKFNRPGQASILNPKEGIAQECNTSWEVIKARILQLKGKTKQSLSPIECVELINKG